MIRRARLLLPASNCCFINKSRATLLVVADHNWRMIKHVESGSKPIHRIDLTAFGIHTMHSFLDHSSQLFPFVSLRRGSLATSKVWQWHGWVLNIVIHSQLGRSPRMSRRVPGPMQGALMISIEHLQNGKSPKKREVHIIWWLSWPLACYRRCPDRAQNILETTPPIDCEH